MMLYIILAALCPIIILGVDVSFASVPQRLVNGRSSPHGRIVGGEPASIEDHPWQVSVQMLGFHVCGGSIISRDFVLTAGHCASYPPGWISVRVNSSIMHHEGTVYRVDQIIRHEDFSMNELGVPNNDVALFKLRTPIEFGQGCRSIALFDDKDDTQEGTLATISGWGALTEGGSLAETLYAVDVPIIAKNVCDEAYEPQGGISPGQICAAYPQGGKDTCQGDSGGPLVINDRQAGIVSWGNGCARVGYPGVYTEIAHFRDWIYKHAGI